MDQHFSYRDLTAAMNGRGAALRSLTILQPIEGEGGKLFPATYAGAKYAMEKRRIHDGADTEQTVDCVLLDSVQSQANRAEIALYDEIERGTIILPLIKVDFSASNPKFRKDVEPVTSLHAPHRLADAILRDSVLDDGTRFSRSKYAESWRRANPSNATPVYELCPTALVFGMWGSPEKPGGLGAKFERAFVSEIVAVDILKNDKRQGFRIDPLSASSKVMVVPNADGGFQISEGKSKGALKPSEINHGNVPFDNENAGVRCRYAEQMTVISLGALRKLRFPLDGKSDTKRDDAGRTVLAAIALCAGILATERGVSLRSRCNLIPTAPRVWELLDAPGETPRKFALTGAEAIALLTEAIGGARTAGLTWIDAPIELKPSPELISLIRESQDRMAASGEESEAS